MLPILPVIALTQGHRATGGIDAGAEGAPSPRSSIAAYRGVDQVQRAVAVMDAAAECPFIPTDGAADNGHRAPVPEAGTVR